MRPTLQRSAAIESILAAMNDRDFLVSALGYLSRELYAKTEKIRGRCLYCMGSMGSVTPIALGVSLAQPTVRVLAIEGDGSLLMNLGTLATLRRYGSSQIRLIVFDNGSYESTGGQVCQPPGFELERVCTAAGLQTSVARNEMRILEFLADPEARVLIIKTSLGEKPPPRIEEPPAAIASAFHLELSRSGCQPDAHPTSAIERGICGTDKGSDRSHA